MRRRKIWSIILTQITTRNTRAMSRGVVIGRESVRQWVGVRRVGYGGGRGTVGGVRWGGWRDRIRIEVERDTIFRGYGLKLRGVSIF